VQNVLFICHVIPVNNYIIKVPSFIIIFLNVSYPVVLKRTIRYIRGRVLYRNLKHGTGCIKVWCTACVVPGKGIKVCSVYSVRNVCSIYFPEIMVCSILVCMNLRCRMCSAGVTVSMACSNVLCR
jgi:hypothetical protein